MQVTASIDDADIEMVILDFFRHNPNPDDPDVHELAGRLGIEPEILEKHIYRIFTKCLQASKDKFPPLKFVQREIGMPLK